LTVSQELLELAQRKFLREITSYADSMEIGPFPRLFVLDFLSKEEKQALKPADEIAPSGQCPLTMSETSRDAHDDTTTQVLDMN
jgi:hypothetical protein